MIPGISESTIIGFSAGIIAILILAILKEVLNKLIKWNWRKIWHIALLTAAVPLILFTNLKTIGILISLPVILFIAIKIWKWRRSR